MSEPNLFPNYEVVALSDAPDSAWNRSFLTPEITKERDLVDKWARSFAEPNAVPRPQLVAVAGDYGTGKTHLLLDAAATVQKLTANSSYILRLVTPEDTPSAWFRILNSPFGRNTQPGAEPSLPLTDLISKLMLESAAHVAEQAGMTRQYAAQIRETPAVLIDLFEDSKLNPSVVEEEFNRQIEATCGPAVCPDVKTALAGLASNVTTATAELWLSGAALTPEQASTLRVQQAQAGDLEIFGILLAAAALLRSANRPFVLMIDELEHFADFDRSHGDKKNLTWLKRLIEALAPTGAMAFVAGRSTAWDAEPNLQERFSSLIRMVILSPADIQSYVTFVIGRTPGNFEVSAAAIQEATGGRMRDVLTLCSLLWEESDAFRKPIEPGMIRAKTSVVANRAIDEVQGLLQQMGFTVKRSATLADVPFDVLGYRSGAPEVAFEFKHVVTQLSPRSDINRFLQKVHVIAPLYPKLLICMVAEGNTDQDLTGIAQKEWGARVRYFDTRTPEFLTQIRDALGTSGPSEPAASTPAAAIIEKTRIIDRKVVEAGKQDNQPLLDELRNQRLALDRQLEELRRSSIESQGVFEKRLNELEAKRQADYRELKDRAADAAASAPGTREAAIASALVPEDPLEKTYADIIEEYTAPRALNKAISSPTPLAALILMAAATAIYFLARDIFPADYYTSASASFNRHQEQLQLILRLTAVASLLVGAFMWIRGIVVTQRYYEHARRLLRELYIRTRSVEDLAAADTCLQETLAIHGPVRGMLRARETLAERIPSFDPSSRPAAAGS